MATRHGLAQNHSRPRGRFTPSCVAGATLSPTAVRPDRPPPRTPGDIQSKLDGDDDGQDRAQDAGSRVHGPGPLHQISAGLAGWSAGNSLPATCQGPQAGGKWHAHGEAQGDQQPGADQQLDHEGQPTSRPSRPGSTPTYSSRAAAMSSRGSHTRLVSASHQRETMLPAPLESSSRNTTTVRA